jgi:hypothetical protein
VVELLEDLLDEVLVFLGTPLLHLVAHDESLHDELLSHKTALRLKPSAPAAPL